MTSRLRAELASPLARWVLTALTALAVAAGLATHALIVGAAAAYAWHLHHRPTRRHRPRRGARR